MSASIRDLRLGFRTLRRSKALVLVSVLALTLGIGLTTMMFSIVYGALMKGLPYEDGDRILMLFRSNAESDIERQSLPVQDFHDFRAQQQGFADLGAYTSGTMNVSGTDRAERYRGSWVSANVFGMTATQPILGRDFRPGEDSPQGARVAVLGHAMWTNRFGARADVLGTTMRVNGVPYEIIGVMPEGFRFPNDDQLWLPLQTDPLLGERGEGQFVEVVGKLKAGVTIDQVNAELATISRRLAADHPVANKGFVTGAVPFIDRFMGAEVKGLLYTMLGAVFFVLLIACTNVANLLLDRAAHRSKEVGVRAALGASRLAIIRMFLSEALVLAAAGTVLGVIVAYVGIDIFNRAIIDTEPPFFIDIGLHPPVLLFSIGVAVLATLFSGLIPALQSSRSDISEVLKDESRGASSLRVGRISKALVVFELALSCGLLVAAGLMIKSVVRAGSADTGFATSTVFTTRVGFPEAYRDTVAQRLFFEQLAERVGALPGVAGAAIASGLPGARQGLSGTRFALEGGTYAEDRDYPEANEASVSPGFFGTLQIPLRQGRLFTDADRLDALPVAIVNERFVRQHLAGADPIGRRIRSGTANSTSPWATIVGVVPDMLGGDPDDPRPAVIFWPFAQNHRNFAYVAARSDAAPLALSDPIRDVVASLNADIPTYWPMTLEQAIAENLWFVRVFGTMFMVFGFVALFLASIGLYAVMSFSVSRRAREVGIRMALGATARDVVRLIFRQGAVQLVIGLGIGLALAAGISRLLAVILYDVKPLDPFVFGGVTVVLAITGAIACLLPAQRATRVQPSDAIRSE
ncbi:MAG TPA: ABC transporter permease [Gemmatimonadaceae bacterium]|nr:ABC transporter permease [Gemmatimonadaceae bacterium]